MKERVVSMDLSVQDEVIHREAEGPQAADNNIDEESLLAFESVIETWRGISDTPYG